MTVTFLLLYGLVIIALLMISAFFSGSETALTATSKARMHHAANGNDKRAQRVLILLEQKERLIGTILLGNNLVNILASALTTSLLVLLYGEAGIAYATIGLTLIVVIFAEILPKSYALAYPERLARRAALPMQILIKITLPVTWLIQLIVRAVLWSFGIQTKQEFNVERHEQELRGAIDLHRGEAPDIVQERHMMKSILDLDDTTVEDVMTHRKQIEMIDADQPVLDLIDNVLQSRFTRIPIYRQEQDNIIGVLHAKSLLRALRGLQKTSKNGIPDMPETVELAKLANPPWFIPDSTSLMDQLLAFRERREHFAIVLDEYGSLMGIVTLEDILEEIVGNIDDETDLKLAGGKIAGVKPQADGSYLIDGAVTLRTLERELEWYFPNEEAVTLAGLILDEARRIPEQGQHFMFYGFRFEIKKRNRNQIREIMVIPPATLTQNNQKSKN